MRGRSGARGVRVALLVVPLAVPLVVLAVSASAPEAHAQPSLQEQLEREVPEVRSVTGDTPRAVADGMVRSLLARFEELAKKTQEASGAGLPSTEPAPAPGSAPASVPVPVPEPPAESPTAEPASHPDVPARIEPIYRYVDRSGRVVYTNIVEAVPLVQRERGKLDLSHIPLNTELGAELSARLRQEHATRIQTPLCDELRRAVDVPLLKRVWDEHAPLVGGAAALIAFTLYIPFVLGRFGVSLSMRMLATIIPLMAVFALGAHGFEQARSSLQALRQKAEPCLAEAFDRLTSRGEGLEPQAELVRSLVVLEAKQGAARAGRAGSPGSQAP